MCCGFVRPQRRGRPEPARPDLSNAPAWLLPSLQVKPSSPSVTAPDPSEHSYPFTGSFPQTGQGLYLTHPGIATRSGTHRCILRHGQLTEVLATLLINPWPPEPH